MLSLPAACLTGDVHFTLGRLHLPFRICDSALCVACALEAGLATAYIRTNGHVIDRIHVRTDRIAAGIVPGCASAGIVTRWLRSCFCRMDFRRELILLNRKKSESRTRGEDAHGEDDSQRGETRSRCCSCHEGRVPADNFASMHLSCLIQ